MMDILTRERRNDTDRGIRRLWDHRLPFVWGQRGGGVEWTLAVVETITALQRRVTELEIQLQVHKEGHR